MTTAVSPPVGGFQVVVVVLGADLLGGEAFPRAVLDLLEAVAHEDFLANGLRQRLRGGEGALHGTGIDGLPGVALVGEGELFGHLQALGRQFGIEGAAKGVGPAEDRLAVAQEIQFQTHRTLQSTAKEALRASC
jgi:hypothetical protein